MLKTVTVDLGDRTYPIYIGSGLLDKPELLTNHIRGKAVLIVTNQTIAPLYLDKCVTFLPGKMASNDSQVGCNNFEHTQ